jgi:anti-anti-sigma factor
MAFAVQVQNMGEFVNLECKGRLVFEEGTNTLNAAVKSQKAHHIVLDFNQVEAIDAAGVGTLTTLHQYACASQRSLVITRPRRQIMRVLRLTKADAVLNVYLNQEDWLRSMFRKTASPLRARMCGT